MLLLCQRQRCVCELLQQQALLPGWVLGGAVQLVLPQRASKQRHSPAL